MQNAMFALLGYKVPIVQATTHPARSNVSAAVLILLLSDDTCHWAMTLTY